MPAQPVDLPTLLGSLGVTAGGIATIASIFAKVRKDALEESKEDLKKAEDRINKASRTIGLEIDEALRTNELPAVTRLRRVQSALSDETA